MRKSIFRYIKKKNKIYNKTNKICKKTNKICKN